MKKKDNTEKRDKGTCSATEQPKLRLPEGGSIEDSRDREGGGVEEGICHSS